MKKVIKVWAIDGDKMKFRYCWKTRKGGNGFGLSDEGVAYTLNTIDQHMVGIVYEKGKGRTRKDIRQGCETYRPRR
jgi:hypothetical protein